MGQRAAPCWHGLRKHITGMRPSGHMERGRGMPMRPVASPKAGLGLACRRCLPGPSLLPLLLLLEGTGEGGRGLPAATMGAPLVLPLPGPV